LISAPGPEGCESFAESRNLQRFGQEATEDCGHYLARDEDKTALKNALFFATDISSYCYFWNLTEVTSTEGNEYAIYVMKKACNLIRLCGTFSDFVHQICLSTGIPGDSQTTQRERLFTPRTL